MDRRSFLTAAIAAASGDGFGPLPSAASRDVLRFRAKLRRLNLPQGRIAYADRGVGPVALFIHGFPLNGYQWRGALDRLSDQRRCLAPDLMRWRDFAVSQKRGSDVVISDTHRPAPRRLHSTRKGLSVTPAMCKAAS